MSDASLTPGTIAELKRLEAEAIKSKLRRHEFSVNTVDFDEGTITVHMNCHPDDVMDKCYTDELEALSDLIVAARNALPALLAALAAKDAEIARLRKALELYANPENYLLGHDGTSNARDTVIESDYGAIARAALARPSQQEQT